MAHNTNMYGPLSLAFLGDAVFGLLVRERLLLTAERPVGRLHTLSTKLVNAAAQADAARLLQPLLTEAERDVYRRGRNAHPGHTPKNQSEGDYHSATGLEALFGWLYLRGEHDRLRTLFDAVWQDGESIARQEKTDP
ncbi:MAG TPA: ribonuclease III [Candidatus Fimenecus excrementigallinarum]|uniref:Mini-ribonuclease 3 n=1 Tax=Candidatus Fimenecus excrementigallinarum TaxID=2840816 RepID=A0A9D1LEK3_9FIRM|nr:ribonuclease III [Candidatus Fimenecus excrementigallinarum]